MSDIRFDIAQLESAIASLLAQHPELGEDDVLRADMFEGLTDLHAVLSELVDRASEAEAIANAIKARRDDLAARKARYERREEAVRAIIQRVLEIANLTKVTLPEATLSLSFRKPAPIIEDETALPDECCQMVRKPVMATIKAWVEAGNIPEGVRMSNGSTSLTIRVK